MVIENLREMLQQLEKEKQLPTDLLTMATFGLSGASLPILVAHPAVIAFLQGTALIFGILLSMLLTQKIAGQPLKLLLPQHLATIIIAIAMWQVTVTPP